MKRESRLNLFSSFLVDFFEKSFPLFILLFFLSISTFTSANGGIGYKGIYINNKSVKTWYNAHNVEWAYAGCGNFQFKSSSSFSGQDFGTFSTIETFQIAGYAVVGWTDNTDWVAGKLLYKVWKQGDSEPGWQEISVGNYGNGNGASQVVCSSANDRVVGYDNGITNLNPGAPGTYNFKIQALGRMQWSGGSFNVNDGPEMSATFTVTSAQSDKFRSKATGDWNTAGTWESSANETNWGTSTLVPGESASKITIVSGHNVTLNANVVVPNITINSGATFTASDNSPRTLTISKSTSGTTTTLSNSGTWSNGAGGSTVVFTGAPSSGDAVHAITGTIAFQKVIINKTGGSSNVGAGFASNSSVSESLEIGAGGYVSTDPPSSFYGTNAILNFNQGVSATYDVNTNDRTWSSTVIPNSITVSSGKVRLNVNRTASGNLVINSGATLEISAGKQLTVSTGLTNSGTLTLKSSATGQATIIAPSSISAENGTFNVEQYLSTARNWYVSSPLSAATVPGSGYTFYRRNEAATNPAEAWPSVSSGTFSPGVGYIALPSVAASTLLFTGGQINTGNVEVDLTASGASSTGFNLIGNPYPAHMTWNSTFTNANATLIGHTIWYRTNAGTANNSGQWSFPTFNTLSEEGVPITATGIIPPMQAFWVKAKQAGKLTLNSTLTLSHQTDNPLKARANTQVQRLRLVVSNGQANDELLVYFNGTALDGYDAYDSPKMFNNIATIPEIFTLAGNERLVINGMSQAYPGLQLPLGFVTGQANNFSIRASQFDNFDADIRVLLFDKQLNTEFDLTAGDVYSFSSDAVNTEERFAVLFKSASGTTDCCDITASGMNVYSNQGRITLSCNADIAPNARFSVYNSSGQLVHVQTMTGYQTTTSRNFDAGVYVLKVENGNRTVALRTIVN